MSHEKFNLIDTCTQEKQNQTKTKPESNKKLVINRTKSQNMF